MSVGKPDKGVVLIRAESIPRLFFRGMGGDLQSIQWYPLWDKTQLAEEAECLTVDVRSNGHSPK
jgi:hypothetical protein